MSDLKEKVIIVTGGSGLIGKEILKKIREQGGICINADINVETSKDLYNIHCDVTSEDSILQTINQVNSWYGGIHGLVNNAYPRTSDWGTPLEKVTYESWKKNVDWQLNSTFLFCQKVMEHMKINGSGSVVNIGSIYGVISPDLEIYKDTGINSPAAYTAIKGGIINFTRFLASYYGRFGIRANCISPGGIFDSQDPVFVSNYERRVPMKRMGRPEDVSGPVAFLLSDSAAYITGHNLMVDGGWTCI